MSLPLSVRVPWLNLSLKIEWACRSDKHTSLLILLHYGVKSFIELALRVHRYVSLTFLSSHGEF